MSQIPSERRSLIVVHVLWCSLVCLLCLSCCKSALASPKIKQARALYREGKKLTLQKKYKEAIIKYKKALSLIEQVREATKSQKLKERLQRSRATFLYIIGKTHQFDRKWTLAKQYYQRALRSNPSPTVELQVRRSMPDVDEALRKLQQERPALVKLVIEPASASVKLEGKGGRKTGHSPFVAQVPPGAYVLTLRAKGFVSQRFELLLTAGMTWQQKVALVPLPTPRRRVPPPKPSQPKPKTHPQVFLWTGVGIAAAGLIGGVVMAGIAADASAQAQTLQRQSGFPSQENNATFFGLADQANGLQLGAIVAFSVGGAALVGGLIAWALLPKPPASLPPKRSPAPSARSLVDFPPTP